MASFSADGRELAIEIDSQFEVRDAATGKRLRLLGQSASMSLLSPDWQHYTDRSGDQRLLTVKATATGQPPIVLSGARVAPAGAVAFSNDGSVLATKAGKRFWIWPLAGGEPRAFDGHDGEWGEIQIDMLAFLPNGRTFISTDWTGRIVQGTSSQGAIERSIDVPTSGSTRGHAISADGRWLVSAQQQSAALFELSNWQLRRTWNTSGHRDIAMSASGRYCGVGVVPTDSRGRRSWIDLGTRGLTNSARSSDTTAGSRALAFGAGDKWLASVDLTGTIRIRDVASGDLLKTLTPAFPEPVLSLAFTPDAQILATGGSNNSIWLWDLRTNTVIRHMEGHFVDRRLSPIQPGRTSAGVGQL